MNKKKKTHDRHPVHHQPLNPPSTKTAVAKEKKQSVPKPVDATEKNMMTPQPQPAVNSPKQKVVNEQEENQVVNDMEETNDVAEN